MRKSSSYCIVVALHLVYYCVIWLEAELETNEYFKVFFDWNKVCLENENRLKLLVPPSGGREEAYRQESPRLTSKLGKVVRAV